MTDQHQLWAAMSQVQRDVAVVRADLGHLRDEVAEVAASISEQSHRVGVLERWKWTAAGTVGAVLILADHLRDFVR